MDERKVCAMKKILCSLLIIVAVIFAGNLQSRADAADYYLGEYETGQIAYLDTTSIRDSQTTRNGYWESNNYSCIVKAVNNDSNKYDSISYEVICAQSVLLRKNGQPCYNSLREIKPYFDTHPVEKALVDYITQIDKRQAHHG